MSDIGSFPRDISGFGRDGNCDISALNNTLQNVARQIGLVAQALSGRFVSGSFTSTNATTTTVTQTAIKSNSVVTLTPTNATAALLQRSQGYFLSTSTVGASFTVSTQTGVAAGTETWGYVVFTPS